MEGVRTQADLDREEKERIEKSDQLKEIARSIGPESSIFGDHVVFKTWQEVVDFQDHCNEQGFAITFTEPPAKRKDRMGFMEDYYHVYPKK